MSDTKVLQLEQELLRLKELHEYPTAILSDVNSYINKNKRKGMMVWDSTEEVPVWASGAAPSDPWLPLEPAPVIPPASGPEFILDNSIALFENTSGVYTVLHTKTFTLTATANVEYFIEGYAYWAWTGAAGEPVIEVEFEMLAFMAGSGTLWSDIMVHGRYANGEDTSIEMGVHVSKRFFQLSKAAGTYTITYYGRRNFIDGTGTAVGRLYNGRSGIIINYI
ncbi:MAG: hypothetical protein HC883_01465 [Bdellovibrionaceae bacterium]|nr:hypothetical protein [Pseudobdellovibrionaceae bacterium]